MRAMTNRTDGPALNAALAGTGALLAAFSLLRLRRPAARQLSEGARLSGMRIASVEVIPYALPFREPYVTARGRLDRREMVLLRLRGRARAWSGSAKRCRSRCAAARRWREVVAELEALERLDALDEDGRSRAPALSAPARCAALTALLDLRGRRAAAGWRRLAAPEAAEPRSAATRRWSPASPPRWRRTR